MNKENASKLWEITQEARDYLIYRVARHFRIANTELSPH